MEHSSFTQNVAPLGPVYVDSLSYLQYSDENFGKNNTGHYCAAIFMESRGSSCKIAGTNCVGDCCDFGDDSCDVHTDAPWITPSSLSQHPTAVVTNGPTANFTFHDVTVDIPESAIPTSFSKTNFDPTSNPTPYPTAHPTEDPTTTKSLDVLFGGIVENHETNTDDEEKDVARILLITLPTCLVVILLALWLSHIRKVLMRRDLAAETRSAKQVEANAQVADTLNPVI